MNLDSSALKEIARGALHKHWTQAIGTTLVADILGAFCTMEAFLAAFGIAVVAFIEFFDGRTLASYMNLPVIAIIFGLVYFFVGALVRLGHIEYCLALLDRRKVEFSMLFCKKDSYWNSIYMKIVCTAVNCAWSLLLIIPGIISHYTYAMTPYILAERPDYSVFKAMRMSRKIMKGYKWQLFCLHLSFLPWKVLGIFTVGLLSLIYRPYQQTAEAALYNEISGRARVYYRRR